MYLKISSKLLIIQQFTVSFLTARFDELSGKIHVLIYVHMSTLFVNIEIIIDWILMGDTTVNNFFLSSSLNFLMSKSHNKSKVLMNEKFHSNRQPWNINCKGLLWAIFILLIKKEEFTPKDLMYETFVNNLKKNKFLVYSGRN